MAEIEMTLPTVQYGNVKVRATPEELGIPDLSNADQVGIVAAVYLNLFTQGFKTGSQMDVSAPVSASQEAPESEAQELLDKGLGGVTELPKDGSAPWTQEVDAKPKPWETGVTAPAVLDAAW